MDKNVGRKNYKLVPPDGGWSYAICLSAVIMMAPTGGFTPSFGMMYNDIMVQIGMGTTAMGLVTGCNIMSLAISGYLTSPLLKVLSLRQLAFIAATLFNIGAFCVAFTNSVATFFICQTLLQNTGFGILYNLAFTSIKEYFLKKRLLATSLVQTSNAIFSMCVPMVIKIATDYYGHRGMLIIISSVGMHVFIGATLLQPVAWHMKKEEIPEENNFVVEKKALLEDNKDTSNDKTSAIEITDIESFSLDNTKKGLDETVAQANQTSAITKIFKEVIDVKLLKEFLLSTVCLILGVAMFTDFIYSVMIPRAFYAEGKSQQYVAWSLSLIAFGDLTTRIIFIFFSSFLMKIGSKRLHLMGTVVAFAARIGMLFSSNPIVTLVFLTIIGIGRCFITILIPVVVADSVRSDQYTGALGISMLVIGILNLALGPLMGAIRDLTDSYEVVFWICTVIFLGVILLWIYELKIKKTKTHDTAEKHEKQNK